MFKNSVFRANVNTINWLKAAGVRAARTMAQTALGNITVGAVLSEINWQYVLSVSIVAGIASVLTSITGIPEVNVKEEKN